MILINLMPPHLRPIKRTPLPHIGSILVLLMAIAAMLYLLLGIRAQISNTRAELEAKTREYQELEDTVREFNELNAQKAALRDKISVIQEILADRIVWSEQLNRLVELTPDNIWFSGVAVTVQNFPERRPKMDSKTNQPMKEKNSDNLIYENVQVKRRVLEVSGYVVTDETGRSDVFPLAEASSKDLEFSRYFKLIRPKLQDTEFEGFAVRGFSMEYLIETPGEAQ
jgi:hypothetical protein